MAIDASIAMGVKPMQIEDPMNALAKMMQIKDAQQASQLNTLKMDEYQRGVTNQNALRQLLTGFGDDHAANQTALMRGGFMKEAQDYGKSQVDAKKAAIDAGKGEAEILEKNLGVFRSYVPQVRTPEEAGRYVAAMYDHPVLGKVAAQFGAKDDVIRRNMEAFAKDPRQWAVGAAGISADKLAEMMKGTRTNTNLGDVNRGETTNYFGEVVPGSTVLAPIGQSADNVANNQRIASEGRLNRGNSMTIAQMADERARDLNDITRNNKPLTEGQAKSALYGSRMAMANKIFDTLEQSGTTTSIPGMNSGYGIGTVLNALSSADQQQLMQAKRDFLNAVLRRESGAVIGESEFANAEKQYFPQINDDKKTIAQKRANREAAMRGVLVDVPEGRRDEIVREISGGVPAAGVPDMAAIDAEIERRKGGK